MRRRQARACPFWTNPLEGVLTPVIKLEASSAIKTHSPAELVFDASPAVHDLPVDSVCVGAVDTESRSWVCAGDLLFVGADGKAHATIWPDAETGRLPAGAMAVITRVQTHSASTAPRILFPRVFRAEVRLVEGGNVLHPNTAGGV